VRDPGDLARLADREIFSALDQRAKRIVLGSAKRFSVVTAISPMPLVDCVRAGGEPAHVARSGDALWRAPGPDGSLEARPHGGNAPRRHGGVA